MGNETEIRSARRGLLLSILLILVAAVAVTYSAWKYLPTLAESPAPVQAGPPVSDEVRKLWAEEDAAAGGAIEDRYPGDTSPPAGCLYPCAFTPLPKDLKGIPPSHRAYINHVCALLVPAIHLRIEAWNGLSPPQPPAGLLDRYLTGTQAIVAKLRAEPTPMSMQTSHGLLIEALELQMTFFERGYEVRGSGQTWEQIVRGVAEGGQASGKLISVWGCWQLRYPGMSPEVSSSLEHHLCALDLF